MVKLPFNLTESDIKTILKEAYNISKTIPKGEIWSDIMKRIGEADYFGEELSFPVELDYYERGNLLEHTVGFCRSKKTGRVYVKTLYDYVRDKLKEEYGNEPDEDEIMEYASQFCDVGGCNPPNDFCGCDEYLGDLHTHPEYPFSPSCVDVEHADREKLKIMCIASGKAFACLFIDPKKDVRVPCRFGDFGSKYCIPVKTYKEDVMGVWREEEYNVCPKEFIEGHEEAWVQEVRRLVREGQLTGICYCTSDGIGEPVAICDFGKNGLLRVKLSELEE